MTIIEHISDMPWASYTEADYTLQQWHHACLIHQHTGPPTSKSQCKLPVRNPNGELNKNGVHAAAAALAGARSPINASPTEKSSAANALRRLYSQLGEQPPPSLAQSDVTEEVDGFLEHHGVKGMRWGVRTKRKQFTKGDRTHFEKAPKRLTDDELQRRINRMEAEKKYKTLNKRDVTQGEKIASEILTNAGKKIATTVLASGGVLAIKFFLKKRFANKKKPSKFMKVPITPEHIDQAFKKLK